MTKDIGDKMNFEEKLNQFVELRQLIEDLPNKDSIDRRALTRSTIFEGFFFGCYTATGTIGLSLSMGFGQYQIEYSGKVLSFLIEDQ